MNCCYAFPIEPDENLINAPETCLLLEVFLLKLSEVHVVRRSTPQNIVVASRYCSDNHEKYSGSNQPLTPSITPFSTVLSIFLPRTLAPRSVTLVADPLVGSLIPRIGVLYRVPRLIVIVWLGWPVPLLVRAKRYVRIGARRCPGPVWV